jgi:type I restriction enzyme R subunit
VGELFVFVDECHHTQSGKLHRTMKELMPNAIFIGFTGTAAAQTGQSYEP